LAHLALGGNVPAVGAGVRERVVLVGNDPAAVLLTEPERESQAIARPVGEILPSSTTEQGIREGDVVISSDVQRLDLE
jgi:hypothetical protein